MALIDSASEVSSSFEPGFATASRVDRSPAEMRRVASSASRSGRVRRRPNLHATSAPMTSVAISGEKEPAGGRTQRRVRLTGQHDDGQHVAAARAFEGDGRGRRRIHQRPVVAAHRLAVAQRVEVDVGRLDTGGVLVDGAPGRTEAHDLDAFEVQRVAQVGDQSQRTLVVEIVDRCRQLRRLRAQARPRCAVVLRSGRAATCRRPQRARWPRPWRG